MSTATTNTPLNHSSNAAFQTWIQEYDSGILTGGHWVNTSDTGQLTLASATKSGSTNTASGYRMYRMSDTLQSTRPVFMKVEFGNGNVTATNPSVWVTFGIATDGAGTLIGYSTTRQQLWSTSAPINNATNVISNYCALPGYLGISFKEGAKVIKKSDLLIVSRTTDDNGVHTGDGLFIIYRTSQNVVDMVCMNFLTSTTDLTMTNGKFGYSWSRTSTLVAGVPQAFKHYGWFPKARPSIASCAFLTSEVSAQQTTTFKLIGNSTAHTYIVLNSENAASDTSVAVFGMLFE